MVTSDERKYQAEDKLFGAINQHLAKLVREFAPDLQPADITGCLLQFAAAQHVGNVGLNTTLELLDFIRDFETETAGGERRDAVPPRRIPMPKLTKEQGTFLRAMADILIEGE